MLDTLLGSGDIMVRKSGHDSYSLITYSLFAGGRVKGVGNRECSGPGWIDVWVSVRVYLCG